MYLERHKAKSIWYGLRTFDAPPVHQVMNYLHPIYYHRLEGNEFTQNEHLGTHMDAPRHFIENGETVDNIGMERLHGPGVTASSTQSIAMSSILHGNKN